MEDLEETILLIEDNELEKKYRCSIKGTAISCLKHLKRYGQQALPKEIWRQILFYALKGMNCKDSHLCISQRYSLYRFLEKREEEWKDEPYIVNFMKETKENFHAHIV